MPKFDFPEGEKLLFDKPFGWSSFHLVKKVRLIIRNSVGKDVKVGHAGTLDPHATGLMILCTGKATKTLQGLSGLAKEYTGTMVLGATTPSYDLETEPDAQYPTEHLNIDHIRQVAGSFLGPQLQMPPAYSAKQVDGERAYTLARKGLSPRLKPAEIHIMEFEITGSRLAELDFRVVCSKGTYIRSLVSDFGKRLHSGAYLSGLRRTAIGELRIEHAWDLEAFADACLPA
jgi:tRNA pseudouridine55 synthase